MNPWRTTSRWFGLVLGLWLAVGGRAWADDTKKDDAKPDVPSLPAVFDKALPENVKDLQAIQVHVKSLLKKIVPATVGLQVGAAQGSGVIVSKDGFVLTAGHVSATPGKDCKIIMPDGRTLKGKTLGANHTIDSGMIQITDSNLGELPFCEMAKSADLKKGNWCLAIGHPGGYQKGRDPVVRLGRIQESSKTFIQSDCTLVGGDSGGPLFDMHGKIIGIHSRIGNLITANIHVPVDTYRDTWEKLAKGEEWGFGIGGKKNADAWLGVTLDPENKGCKISDINADSPAAKGGLKANDIVTMFDGKKVASQDDLINFVKTKRPGNEVAMVIQRGEETITLRVTLGRRPGKG